MNTITSSIRQFVKDSLVGLFSRQFAKDGSLGVIFLLVIIMLSIALVRIEAGRISWVRHEDFLIPLSFLALVVYVCVGRSSGKLEGTASRKEWTVNSWLVLTRTLIGAFVLFIIMLIPFGSYAIISLVVGFICGFVGFVVSTLLGVVLMPSKIIHRKLIGVIPSVSVAYGMGFLVWPLVFL